MGAFNPFLDWERLKEYARHSCTQLQNTRSVILKRRVYKRRVFIYEEIPARFRVLKFKFGLDIAILEISLGPGLVFHGFVMNSAQSRLPAL